MSKSVARAIRDNLRQQALENAEALKSDILKDSLIDQNDLVELPDGTQEALLKEKRRLRRVDNQQRENRFKLL